MRMILIYINKWTRYSGDRSLEPTIADLGVACKATGGARATWMLRVHPLGDAIFLNPGACRVLCVLPLIFPITIHIMR